MPEEFDGRRSPSEQVPGNIRYVGFDLDGTLIDTLRSHYKIFGAFIHDRYGIDPVEAAGHYRATSGLPTADQIASLLEKHHIPVDRSETSRLGQEADALLENAEGIPFPEVVATLKRLKDGGYRVFVSSSHPTDAVRQILAKHELDGLVDASFGTDFRDPSFRKGEAHFRKVAEELKIPYEEFLPSIVFIGDGASDMEAAKGSGVFALGRAGTGTAGDLMKSGAYAALDDLSNLPELLTHPEELQRLRQELKKTEGGHLSWPPWVND